MDTSQLRMYRIADGTLDEFVRLWKEGVAPLREAHGFRVEGAWTIPEQNRFVWIITYDGPGTFEEADAAYYASPERKALDPDPAELIGKAETHFLQPVE
jgi:hypothetical protein